MRKTIELCVFSLPFNSLGYSLYSLGLCGGDEKIILFKGSHFIFIQVNYLVCIPHHSPDI